MFRPPFPFYRQFGPGFRRGGPFGRPFDGPPGGDGPFGGPEGPGRKRQRRGDIKFILLELINEQPRHGYDLIKAMEERSGGFYRPSPGMIYPTLQLLEEEGSLTSTTKDDKRIYTITAAGKEALQAFHAEADDPRNRQHGPGHHGRGNHNHGPERDVPRLKELRRTMMALTESVMQIARFGTPEQVQAAQALVEKTNQEIHAILAGKEPITKL
jgi:DNA-binding PadR family transcriptional regulator